jgi:ATP-dependent protease ClpP protease subunit
MNKKSFDFDDTFLLDSGRIFLREDIGEESEEKFTRSIRYCIYNNIKSIYIYINSEGGDVDSACAIIDEINGAKELGFDVNTIAFGRTYSAAAYILTFGSKKYATRNSTIMLHPILFSLELDYMAPQKAYTAFTDRKYEDIIKQVANNCDKKTKPSIQKFINDIQHGLWLDPQQAKKMKIIDDLWDYSWEKTIDEESNRRRNKKSSEK